MADVGMDGECPAKGKAMLTSKELYGRLLATYGSPTGARRSIIMR